MSCAGVRAVIIIVCPVLWQQLQFQLQHETHHDAVSWKERVVAVATSEAVGEQPGLCQPLLTLLPLVIILWQAG